MLWEGHAELSGVSNETAMLMMPIDFKYCTQL
jgi:hypothetical protein